MNHGQIDYSIGEMKQIEVYKNQYKQDMEEKIRQINQVLDKYNRNEQLTREELAFMIHEIQFTYDPSVSKHVPYYPEHIERVKKEFFYGQMKETVLSILHEYVECMNFIYEKELRVFGRKKLIDSCIDTAKEVLKKTQKKTEMMENALIGTESFEEAWKEQTKKSEVVIHQFSINRPYVPKVIEWILTQARLSIQYQMETAQGFFYANEKKSVKSTNQKELDALLKIYHHYKKAIEIVANEPIPLLDTGQHLERMKNHLRDGERECESEFQQVQSYFD